MPRQPLLALLLVLITSACSGHERTLEGLGLKVELPRGWTGEIYGRGQNGELTDRSPGLVIAHVANFRLGPHDGYDPLGTVVRGGRIEDARTGMTRDGVGVSLFDYGRVPGGAPELVGPLELRAADRKDLEGFPSLRATYMRAFSVGGHDLELIVEFGADRPQQALVAKVNDVLGTLRVSGPPP